MFDIQAKVLVTKKVADSLSSRPDWVRECMTEAERSMSELARERGRHVAAPPRYVNARDTRLGYVELTFTAPTEVR